MLCVAERGGGAAQEETGTSDGLEEIRLVRILQGGVHARKAVTEIFSRGVEAQGEMTRLGQESGTINVHGIKQSIIVDWNVCQILEIRSYLIKVLSIYEKYLSWLFQLFCTIIKKLSYCLIFLVKIRSVI